MHLLPTQMSHHRGFTLIELLVSMSIFTVVSTMAVGVLVVMIDANRKSQSIETAMSNLSFALDSMTRDIRTGTYYNCAGAGLLTHGTNPSTSDCSGGASSFSFIESGTSLTASCSNRRVAYRRNGGVIERSTCGSTSWDPITSPGVNITSLEFVVTGTTAGDDTPPLVSIFIAGSVSGIRNTGTDFSIQTSVTQQVLDI